MNTAHFERNSRSRMTQLEDRSRAVRDGVRISEGVGTNRVQVPNRALALRVVATKQKRQEARRPPVAGTIRSADLAGNVVVRIVRRSGRSRSVGISAGAVHAGVLGADEPRVDRRIGIDVTRRVPLKIEKRAAGYWQGPGLPRVGRAVLSVGNTAYADCGGVG